MKKKFWFVQVGLGFFVTAFNIIYLPQMPNPMVIHFSITGHPNGTASAVVGLLVPLLIGWVITALFYLLERATLNGRIPYGSDPVAAAWVIYVVSILFWIIIALITNVLIHHNLQ